MIKAIIFDFDGVIVESVNIKSSAFGKIYHEHGKIIVNKIINHHLANGGMSRFEKFRFYHKEYLGKNLSENELSEIGDQFSNFVLNKVISAPYVRGAYEFLSEYYHTYDFYISTATPEAEIIKILEEKQLIDFFKKVYGSPENKNEHVRKIIRNGQYLLNEVVFVGDSPSDRDAASENNISFIARVADENSQLASEKKTIQNLENFRKEITQGFFHNNV